MPPRESLKYEVKLTSVWKLRVFNTHFYLVEWYAQLLCVIPFQGSLIVKIKSGFLDNQLRVTAVVRLLFHVTYGTLCTSALCDTISGYRVGIESGIFDNQL